MPNDQFNKIKNAGKSKNKQALDSALVKAVSYTRLSSQSERESSIDIKKCGRIFLTPAAECALENDNEAVEFLRKNGANVDYIGYGYALSGNYDAAEKYRNEYGAQPKYIAQGFAEGKHIALADKFLSTFGTRVLRNILHGHAIAGNIDKIESMLPTHPDDSIDYIAQGFAQGNHHALVEEFHTKHPTEMKCHIGHVAYGYALAGNIDKAKMYIKQYDGNYWLMPMVVSGLAAGNHVSLAKQFQKNSGFDIKYMAQGFAMAGNIVEAERARVSHNADVNAIAEGYACAGIFDGLEICQRNHNLYIRLIIETLIAGDYHQEAVKYQKILDGSRKNWRQEIASNITLKKYIADTEQNPISINSKITYPEDLTCRLSNKPPLIPVSIHGSGPFDFDFVMSIAAKDGMRQIHLEQVLKSEIIDIHAEQVLGFKISDIHPAMEVREKLYKMAPENVQESNNAARSSPRA